MLEGRLGLAPENLSRVLGGDTFEREEMILKLLIQIALLGVPWRLRRILLNALLRYSIHPSAKIGISLVMVDSLVMEAGSRIGHLNMIRNLRLVEMGEQATIGRTNYISGYRTSPHGSFQDHGDRISSLRMGAHSAITNSHHIDCTDAVEIGSFSTIAGYNTQVLTHSIDLVSSKQTCGKVTIGSYCFIGTRVVFLAGVSIADGVIVGAGSVVNKSLEECYCLYGGVPAKFVKNMVGCAYHERTVGAVA